MDPNERKLENDILKGEGGLFLLSGLRTAAMNYCIEAR